MIFAIDSAKTAKRAIDAAAGCACMRIGCKLCRAGNRNRINAMRCTQMHSTMRRMRMAARACHPLRAARDIDMRKTSLDRPEPDGYMPSLFSTD
ncbi:hypothetical protein [Burkholderia sp. BE17]|uniref:hypothetical protein n=1 Tax=Burkholderia sp. BE17 TaxID=2656644 RepID=UPI00187B4183|nr:hypothetical protein [Burkholderia sp. BE17]